MFGAYCAIRKRKNWCDESNADACHKAVLVIAKRARQQDKKLRAESGGGVRDFPSYLSKALQQSLIDDADDMKQSGSR